MTVLFIHVRQKNNSALSPLRFLRYGKVLFTFRTKAGYAL